MKIFTEPSQIAWSLIWRATLFSPVLLAFTFIYFGTWIARIFLPVMILISVLAHDWLLVAICGGGWIVCISLWQWRSYRNLWEEPPSLL
ncbi:MAG: hypothetical protein P1U58_01105 [Verrucomicrobiales bacterium]|nr:hypothetical protein [Verrucomicrobiales bacterium]